MLVYMYIYMYIYICTNINLYMKDVFGSSFFGFGGAQASEVDAFKAITDLVNCDQHAYRTAHLVEDQLIPLQGPQAL